MRHSAARVAALLALTGIVRGQEEAQGPPVPTPQPPIVKEIVIEPPESADLVRRLLRSKVGAPLRREDVARDHEVLHERLRVRSESFLEDVPGGVRLIFVIQDERTFDRFEFKGLSKFTEREVQSVLEIDSRQRINRLAAEQYAATLRDRYRRRGHYFVEIRIVEDAATSTLTFFVDEGPEVEIRRVDFVGNHSYPAWAPLRFYDNLVGSPRLQSAPSGFLGGGEPYSPEIVDEDLDRLRLWYRQQGFRDARVALAGVVFTDDRDQVDLTILVDEGRRYRIKSVDLLQTPAPGREQPLYPKEEVLEVVEVEPGEFYDFARIEIDKEAITRFYGERGHPPEGRYGRGIENAFRIADPLEVVDPKTAEVALTYVIEEGTPKDLRAVRVRGNTDTQSRVVLRKVYQMPGERLDIEKIDRSLGSLDALRYFQNPMSFGGVRFELLPVEDEPDLVDLAIDVQEGDTGAFLWGAGFSTALGAQARISLSKRNFDITRFPSSFNPITWITEISQNEAFHGAGQELELMLMPGTEVSQFNLSFYDPDIFRTHFDTIGLRVDAYKRLQRFDSFFMDALGAVIGLQRNFTDQLSLGLSVRQETVHIDDVDANAPAIVFDSEGRTEMRGLRATLDIADVDFPIEPTEGYRFRAYGEVVGGPFGADADFYKTGFFHTQFVPLHRDHLGRAHVLRLRGGFDYGRGFGDSDELFLTERLYIGGNNLRGFDQRRAGPSQFGKPIGGEARLLSSLEYYFPLVSTKREGQLRQTEVLRGVIFVDGGMLGLELDDLGPPRLSAGFGVRILIPLLNVPIQLDVGWPILKEETDDQRQVYFSLSRL